MSSSLFSNSSSKPDTSQNMTSIMDQAKQMYKMVQASSNPQQMLQQMALNNPQVQAAYQTMSAAKDPKAAFYAAARAKGLTDEQIQNGLETIAKQFQ